MADASKDPDRDSGPDGTRGNGPSDGGPPADGPSNGGAADGSRAAWLKGAFLGSKLRIAGTVLLALLVLVVVGFLLGFFGLPNVESVENRFGDVNETTTVIETDLVVNNPNPIGIKLGGSTLEYAVRMNDVRMAEGTYEGLGVGAGRSTLNLTSYMDNTKIPEWWVSHVRNGEYTSVEVDATVRSSLLPFTVGAPKIQRDIPTNITDAFNSTTTESIDANLPLVSDPVLYVNETSGHWGEVTEAETEVVMTFVAYNPKSYAIGASEIGYDMTMNDIAVGEGATTSEVVIPPGETRKIVTTTRIRNQRLDDWWVSHLQRNQRTTLTVDFYARIDLTGSSAGGIRIPLDTMTSHFETDLFGTKVEGTAAGGSETATPTDDGSGDTATPTDASTGGTETPTDDGPLGGTDTETSTATDDGGSSGTDDTPTATPTDDGGLLG